MARLPFTNRVRELRTLNNNLTQLELGKAIGVTRQTVIAIEQDRYSPSLESAFRIARLLNVALEEVFIWRGDADAE